MKNRACLVVGAGLVGSAKIRNLLECGAVVKVVALDVCAEVGQLAQENKVALKRKEYEETDLQGMSVVIAATSDPGLNHRVYDEGVARGCFVNVVDDPDYCDFYFGSIVRRGALQIAISTTGESPAFAQQLRQEIDDALPGDTGKWLAQLGELRRHVNRVVEPGPHRISMLRELARREACHETDCPCRALAAREAFALDS
ncbi:MAG: bifunctional precorrin-2 dehydrogenase/sirohydrochlorin ferrochelatase [Acidobacteriota bacterium]|nr:bifunctional precorrin-2 dehydrogenase/sirohydrochlorin ferrochelatase [Acidobacteriota bacterium]